MYKRNSVTVCVSVNVAFWSQSWSPTPVLIPLTTMRLHRAQAKLNLPCRTLSCGDAQAEKDCLTWNFSGYSLLTTSSENLSSLFLKLVYLAEMEPERNEIPQ